MSEKVVAGYGNVSILMIHLAMDGAINWMDPRYDEDTTRTQRAANRPSTEIEQTHNRPVTQNAHYGLHNKPEK